MYSNNLLNFQESPAILNAPKKKVWKLIVCTSFLYKQDFALIILQGMICCETQPTNERLSGLDIAISISMLCPKKSHIHHLKNRFCSENGDE